MCAFDLEREDEEEIDFKELLKEIEEEQLKEMLQEMKESRERYNGGN